VVMVINIVLGPCCTAAAHYSPRKIHFNPTPLSELPTPVRLSSWASTWGGISNFTIRCRSRLHQSGHSKCATHSSARSRHANFSQ